MEKVHNKVIIAVVAITIVASVFIAINVFSPSNDNSTKKIETKQEKKKNNQEKNTNKKKEDIVNNEENINENKDEVELDSSSSYEDDVDSNIQDNSLAENYQYIPVTNFNVRIDNNRIYTGTTANLTTTIYPDNATDQEVSYSSSNKNIAIVSKNGVVTGINPGECYITISVKNASSGQIRVTVLSSNNTTYNNEENATNNSNSNFSVVYEKSDTDISSGNTISESKKNATNTTSSTINESKDTNSISDNNTTPTDSNLEEFDDEISDDDSESNITADKEKKEYKNNSTTKKKIKKKNGWYNINGKKYYYKNNIKQKNTYIDYIYLNSNGVAQPKIGNFDATLYGARAWANQNISLRKKPSHNSSLIMTIPSGSKMLILSNEDKNTKYIKVSYNNKIGYVYSNYLYINLPDIMPDIIYSISNANKSIYKSNGKSIPNITGKNLYGYKKQYNKKIAKNTYYAPLLYPVSKQLQKAYNIAKKDGYNLKIYDTYRPYDVSMRVNKEFRNLYNSNNGVKKAINYDKNGKYWGPSWFLAKSISRHNRGDALDLTITNKNGVEYKAQTPMHTLDTRSLRKYNNKTANKLSNIMTSAGFETLESEWWHFQEDSYKTSPYTSFRIR